MEAADAFGAMRFRHDWRDYQARVLDDLQTHLEDRRLHVVAAPGAGKTVLGLEVMRRIARPTLILAPSIAIRNQWVDRLVELFLPKPARPAWVSTDLSSPGLVTVATYQALHTDYDVERLAAAGISVVILDEAHHLRNAWWEALARLAERLDPKTVSLTATPPYDVASAEWQRYNELCGPIDAEISIPELVKSGDLAPHQDLVHITQLENPESYRDPTAANAALFHGLARDPDMVALLTRHPWVTDTKRKAEELLSEPQLFSAMLVYLADAGAAVPPYALRLLGVGRRQVPRLTLDWLGILCQGLRAELPERMVRLLTEHGALYRNRVTLPLRNDEERERVLQNAPEKYYSIRDIAALERGLMGDGLRLAILTEHVGSNALKIAARDPGYYGAHRFAEVYRKDSKAGRIDAGSVFERLRQEPGQPADIAVLTGTVVIVPAGSLKGAGISCTPLPQDARYERVELSGAAADRRVGLISGLVRQATVRVLIGTRALLGQGWDLPAINTLILATNVKSFVSSNQVRGRAIRRDPEDPAKAAHIWHIATAAPTEPGPEIEALEHRFDTFVHLDPRTGGILSGYDGPAEPAAANAAAFARAGERADMAARWQGALVTGRPNPRIRHRLETQRSVRGLVRTDAAAQIVPRVGLAGGAIAGWGTMLGDPVSGAAVALGAGVVLKPAIDRLRRLADHGSLAGSLRQAGLALLHAMIATGQIRTPRAQLSVQTGKTPDGLAYCTLAGATLPEETRFLATLEEFFAPIGNPRYLIVRESYLGRFLRIAPYPVPRDLGARKELATALLDGWNRHVGPARLVYTRTFAGRVALLQARTVTLSDATMIRRSSVWE